jgi:hypothetical protein
MATKVMKKPKNNGFSSNDSNENVCGQWNNNDNSNNMKNDNEEKYNNM